MASAVRVLIRGLGENPERDGLRGTPPRVVRSLFEMTCGYRDDPAAILSTTFAEQYDEMIVVEPVEFWSLCEHHLLPFHGTARVGYLPSGRVVGLSKIARLVHCFARRLQIQERMTKEIAEAIRDHLGAAGVGVVVRATHLCMAARGVRSASMMTTSSMLGAMRGPAARSEFLSLARR
ncbi:MAG: GTP cyclohydrolase I FolE [Acidobacteria bacterium RBG_16_68_9]|nr:MAG: GTP cyclohydrolase I FolE [Acidobacteria bacterium RBG_16_68_9]